MSAPAEGATAAERVASATADAPVHAARGEAGRASRGVAAPSEAPRAGTATVEGIETHWVRVQGIERRVLSAGAGWPLVLLHGIAGSADEWLEIMPALAKRHRVIAPDAPGHGFSEKPARYTYSVDAYAQSTLGVMDAYGIRRAPLVAISGGGTVALHIARSYPERVSKLVLANAAGLGREVSWSYRLATMPLMRHAFRRSTNARSIEAFGRALLYNPHKLPADWVARRQRIWATDGAVDAFFATVRSGLTLFGQRGTFTSRLNEIRQPVFIIWGRQDPIIPVAHGIAAARAIPNAELRIFEECGHMPIWEYPEEFVKTVEEFLGTTG